MPRVAIGSSSLVAFVVAPVVVTPAVAQVPAGCEVRDRIVGVRVNHLLDVMIRDFEVVR